MARIDEAREVDQRLEDATAVHDVETWIALIGGFVLGCLCSGIVFSFLLYV